VPCNADPLKVTRKLDLTATKWLHDNIVSIVPDLPEPVIAAVIQKLTLDGVTRESHLTVLGESDLTDIGALLLVNRRLLLKGWKGIGKTTKLHFFIVLVTNSHKILDYVFCIVL